MRRIFYSLLALNLVFLGWNLVALRDGPAESAAPRNEAAAVAPLVLFSAEPQPPRTVCSRLGPWSTWAQARHALVRLTAAGLDGRVATTSRTLDLHWVYLPPFASERQARSVLSVLQAQKIDSFIVHDHDEAYRNAISLGFFASAEAAHQLRAKMVRSGYSAQMTLKSRLVTEYWLVLAGHPANGSVVTDFVAGQPGVKRDAVPCQEN